MAGRNKIPIDVQMQYGKPHMSNDEISKRMDAEKSLSVPFTKVRCPAYMTDKKKRARFRKLANMLQSVSDQLCTELDVDALAAYVDAQANYEFNQGIVDDMHSCDEIDTYELERRERIRNAAQSKADKLRSDLLLEPAARARAAMPKKDAPKKNKFSEFDVGR